MGIPEYKTIIGMNEEELDKAMNQAAQDGFRFQSMSSHAWVSGGGALNKIVIIMVKESSTGPYKFQPG